jgi:membrane fusion protein (multidrug efflux system)
MSYEHLIHVLACIALAFAFSASHAPSQAQILLSDPLVNAMPYNVSRVENNDGFSARGLLSARAQAIVSSEIAGRIVEIPFREGERFAAGDTLARFECAIYDAQLAGARGAELFAQRQLEQKRELVRLRSAGEIEVGLAQARLDEVAAQAALQEVLVSRCTVRAPFAGAVVARAANAGESVAAGAPLIEIVDDSDYEIRVLSPSHWLAWLTVGEPFTFEIDEADESLAARVEAIGASVDAASQTILVIGRLLAHTDRLVPGMSGSARFAPPAVER